ncbi:MAG: hypothetical protein AB1420_16550 [Bacillota bacterium]
MERKNVYYKVLEYPVVQYITLRQRVIHEDMLLIDLPNRIEVRLVQNNEEYQRSIRWFKVKDPGININWLKDIIVFSANYRIEDTKYRTNRIYTFGAEEKGLLQVSRISKDLFYRSQLYFLIYNWQGDRLPITMQVYRLE